MTTNSETQTIGAIGDGSGGKVLAAKSRGPRFACPAPTQNPSLVCISLILGLRAGRDLVNFQSLVDSHFSQLFSQSSMKDSVSKNEVERA